MLADRLTTDRYRLTVDSECEVVNTANCRGSVLIWAGDLILLFIIVVVFIIMANVNILIIGSIM